MGKDFFVTDMRRGSRWKAGDREAEAVLSEQLMFNKASEAEQKAAPKEVVKVRCKPLGDRLIVRRLEAEQKGLIIIPNSVKEPLDRGTVEAVGPGRFDEPTYLKPGDTVMFSKHSVVALEIDGEEFLMMRESDVLAVL